MKQLEDRIKDRLEGYESSLPEGDLAEFKALLDVSASDVTKRAPANLAWLLPIAVAAGLAMFFVLGHGRRQDMIQVVDGSPLVADVVETQSEASEMMETETVTEVAIARTYPSASRKIKHPDATVVVDEKPGITDSEPVVSEQSVADQPGNIQQTYGAEQESDQIQDNSPLVQSGGRQVGPKVAQTIAGVLGGTSALALAGVHPPFLIMGASSSPTANPGGDYPELGTQIDTRTGNDTHYKPLRTGLSLRIPLSDRWSLTTGLEYSWYASRLSYSLSGIHKQSVHYLGVPLRADFTIARNRWLDIYAGAGGAVDFCMAAYDNGRKIARDGMGFSLIGTGGIQFNITKDLGLFLDPAFSWNIPSENRKLDTYRSEHPFMFAVSAGLRITMPGRK